jgi:hypothetical protein
MDSDEAFDADVWQIAATELGLNGIAIPGPGRRVGGGQWRWLQRSDKPMPFLH